MADQDGLPKREWSANLIPLLTSEAQQVYFTLMRDEVANYDLLRVEVLVRYGLSYYQTATEFHLWA